MDPITEALEEARALLGRAGCPRPELVRWKGGQAVCTAAFACAGGKDPQDLAGRWQRAIEEPVLFARIEARGGYVNFLPGARWRARAAAWAEEVRFFPPPARENAPVPRFWAEIEPGDWRFLTALAGRAPAPERAARRDGENPAWLVRYTARALPARGGTGPGPGDERILSLAAECALARDGRSLARSLTALARACWAEQAGPAARRAAARVLERGYEALA